MNGKCIKIFFLFMMPLTLFAGDADDLRYFGIRLVSLDAESINIVSENFGPIPDWYSTFCLTDEEKYFVIDIENNPRPHHHYIRAREIFLSLSRPDMECKKSTNKLPSLLNVGVGSAPSRVSEYLVNAGFETTDSRWFKKTITHEEKCHHTPPSEFDEEYYSYGSEESDIHIKLISIEDDKVVTISKHVGYGFKVIENKDCELRNKNIKRSEYDF